MCGAWRMCWISTRSPTIRTSQSSASTSYPTRWWLRNVRPCPKSLDARSATTYEYERKGMLNIFAFFEPNSGWRHLDITERRTAVDFALSMRRLVEEHYPTTEKVRVVLDNLNTHSPASLYKAFEPEEARRLLHRLEFHHTPTHASWLNIHGGDRALGALAAVFGASHPRCREACKGDWGMGAQAQRRRGDGAMALHGIRGSGEAGTPLPGTTVVVEY